MVNALIGGALIGLAVTLMLLFNGRVTGISGIIGGALKPQAKDFSWRLSFVAGLVAGGFVFRLTAPETLIPQTATTYVDYAVAGALVGFGTLLGNGCTSGHGVCGISRLSVRSILATMTFIAFGVLSVVVFKLVRGVL